MFLKVSESILKVSLKRRRWLEIDHILSNIVQSEAMAILLTCRLYTKPLYLLKQLRNIWEREVHDGSFEVSSREQSQSVPVEFLTMRRRPARRCSSARSSTQPKVYSFDFDEKPVSSILADLKQATDRLAEGIKNVDFLNGLEQSRDSGFGSFSDSIISDTDESTVSQEDDCPGYIPVTMTGLQVILVLKSVKTAIKHLYSKKYPA